MPRNKKKFIDKKNAVVYSLAHRSQKDPLQADEDAPQRVLLPFDERQAEEIRKEEQKKFGIAYEDEYDYMQHLRGVDEFIAGEEMDIVEVGPAAQPKEVKDKNPFQLPSELFASESENKVGLLNLAAPVSGPRLDWDPDIVAGLDDDFDFDDPENQLDDDFMAKANAECGTTEEGGNDCDEEEYDSDACSDVGSDFGSNGSFGSFAEEETKSHFTNYSLTSAVIRRNEGLTTLDDQFEKLMVGYQDDNMGDMMHEDITGPLQQGSLALQNILEEHEAKQGQIKLKDIMEEQVLADLDAKSSDSETEQYVAMEIEPKREHDCESIISTYSNLYNHPASIVEPRRKKTPSTRSSQCTEAPDADPPVVSKACTIRPPGETLEEKRARKQAVKEERKKSRAVKKELKTAFKTEEMRHNKQHSFKQNLLQQSVKL